MAKRHDLRQLYMDGWYNRDPDKLLAAAADDFIFDDPAEPKPVDRDGLPAYMVRWLDRVGGHNTWRLTYEVRQDQDGIITDWEWWEVVGTQLCGMAVVKTGDEGVLLERICYFSRGAAG